MDVQTILRHSGYGHFSVRWESNWTKRRIKPTDAMKPKDLAAKRKARRKMQAESRRRNRGK